MSKSGENRDDDGSLTDDLVEVPTRLYVSPASVVVSPPVRTRVQLLPFDDLPWETFERLAFRLARLEQGTVYARRYGTRGQKQHGIDLYARKSPDGFSGSRIYVTYQCKEVKKLTETDVDDLVDEFLKGKWASLTAEFVLVTSHSSVRTQVADAVERATVRLATAGVDFRVWDAEELSGLLKDRPELIDDFFGRPWAVAFCGDERAASLGDRLDGMEVADYKKRLGALYRAVFSKQDCGLRSLARPGLPELLLAERFVIPDIECASPGSASDVSSDPTTLDRSMPASGVPAGARAGTTTSGSLSELNPTQRSHRQSDAVRPPTRRVDADKWLAQGGNKVLLGSPGSGKSTLLRFLLEDLLSGEPRLKAAAETFGDRLPVWLPFAFWTSVIARQPTPADVSLLAALEAWFGLHDAKALWPLVAKALRDKRLLLVVDGLDEWMTEAAGSWAAATLQSFLDANSATAVVSSRPYGLHKLPITGANWQLGELAPLNPDQRRAFAEHWFRHEARTRSVEPETHAETHRTLETFLRDIDQADTIRELASVPLFLLLLIDLRIEQVELPVRRFEAYEAMAILLLRDHPSRRKMAGDITQSSASLKLGELRGVMRSLAFGMQVRGEFDASPIASLEKDALDFLVADEGLQMPHLDASRIAQDLLDLAEGKLGVLVRQGVAAASFFHRSLLEFFAAEYISRLPVDQHLVLLGKHGADPRWREVLLCSIGLTQKPADKTTLVKSLENSDVEYLDRLALDELLAEAAFGEVELPPVDARRLAQNACTAIETHVHLSHRSNLLRFCVRGLHSSVIKDLVRSALERWVFRDDKYPAGVYDEMRLWPRVDWVRDLLSAGLCQDDDSTVQAAAGSLAVRFAGDERTGQILARVAGHGSTIASRAAALEALARGWPRHPAMSILVAESRRQPRCDLRTIAFAIAADRRELDQRLGGWPPGETSNFDTTRLEKAELESLFHELFRSEFAGRDQSWRLGADLLTAAFGATERLRKVCFEAIATESSSPFERRNQRLAFTCLIQGFAGDNAVAELLASRFRSDRHAFMKFDRSESWPLLVKHFRNHSTLVPAIEEWSARADVHEMEIAHAAGVAPTPVLKAVLIRGLKESFPFWPAKALVENWGVSDPEVRECLLARFRGSPGQVASVAEYTQEVLGVTEAHDLLMKTVSAPRLGWRDRVVRALARSAAQLEPTGGQVTDLAAAACLKQVEMEIEDNESAVALVAAFPASPGVRQLALRLLDTRNPPRSEILAAYPDDKEFQRRIGDAVHFLPMRLRTELVFHLDSVSGVPQDKLRILRRWDSEVDAEVKIRGSMVFHKTLQTLRETVPTDPNILSAWQAARDYVRSAVGALGLDLDARRMAAWVGLLALDDIAFIRDARDPNRPEKSVGLWLHPDIDGGATFAAALAKRWTGVQAALGGQTIQRLSHNEDHGSAWATMALVAADYPSLGAELQHAIANGPELKRRKEVLRFLIATDTNPVDLLDLLMAAIDREEQDYATATVAVESLSAPRRVGLDPEKVRGELEARASGRGISGGAALQALLAGRVDLARDRALLAELLAAEKAGKSTSMKYSLYFQIRYGGGAKENLFRFLREDLSELDSLGFLHLAGDITRSLAGRLRNDAEVRDLFEHEILSEKTPPSAVGILARILAQATPLSEILVVRLKDLIRKDRESVTGHMGFDPLAGEPCTLESLVLELFAGD